MSGFSANSDLVIIREDDTGINAVEAYASSCRVSCNVTLAGSGRVANYYVSRQSALPAPEIEALPVEQDIVNGQARYLIISHPDFIGGDGNNLLEDLAAEISSEMGSAKVVDIDAIYAQFGYHLFDPLVRLCNVREVKPVPIFANCRQVSFLVYAARPVWSIRATVYPLKKILFGA